MPSPLLSVFDITAEGGDFETKIEEVKDFLKHQPEPSVSRIRRIGDGYGMMDNVLYKNTRLGARVVLARKQRVKAIE